MNNQNSMIEMSSEYRARRTRQKSEEILSLRDVFDIFLNNWKWFAASAIVCVALCRLYLATQPFVYQRQAVMLVKEEGNGSGSKSKLSNDALMQLNGVMMGSSVKNEVYILQSHQLVQEVVKALHLDVLYTCKHHLQKVSLYRNKPFEVRFLDLKVSPGVFHVHIINANECEISGMQNKHGQIDFKQHVRFGQTINSPLGHFILIPNTIIARRAIGEDISVTHLDLETATNIVASQISSTEMDKESTLVRITCTDTNIDRADDILNALLDAYKRSIVEDKNLIAQSTAEFIDERINIISRELSDVERELADFKQENNLIDLTQNAQAFLSQSSSARQHTIQVEAQQSMVQSLMDYLRDNSKGNTLIPTMGGLADNGIQSQIAKFNELMLTRNRLADNSGVNGPTIEQMDANLNQMRQGILSSMQGYLSSVNIQLRQAQQEEHGLKGTMSSVPQKEKHVLDISRQQSIKETLYTYLLNKREETALQLAITEANIRVVERPFGSRAPIAPRKVVISFLAFFLGLIIPFVFFYVRNMLNMGVRGRKDIEKYTSIPILGEIPHRKEGFEDSKILVDDRNTDPISESFRMMRFSLNFINKDARIIMFTSTTPGEGKTFVSRNFAVTLGMTGKRVILIDSDIRKRTQSRLSGLSTHQEGFTSYLSGSCDDISSLILLNHLQHGIDFLPAGIVPPNPAELLMSDKLETLILELKQIYDYIVIDNVPAQVVADAGIVNRVADMTIYVVREGKIDRRYLPEIQRLYDEKKFKNLCVLLNDSHMEKKKYGYGYGYEKIFKDKRHRNFHLF